HRRWPLTTFGILWFFAGHVLTSNVIPLELAFEHRNYLPLMGIIVATIQPISELARRLRISITARRILTAISLAALALLCAIQSATWGDPMLLAMTLEQRNPTSQRASYDLARQYLTHA